MFKKTIFQNTVNKHRTQDTEHRHRTQNTNTANFRSLLILVSTHDSPCQENALSTIHSFLAICRVTFNVHTLV